MSTVQRNSLSLLPITDADLQVLFEFQNDPLANEMADFPARDETAFFEHWRNNILANADVVAQGIWVDDTLVGSICLWSMMSEDDTHSDWFIGYWIGRDYWGQGYASQGVNLFVNQQSQRPILAHVVERNKGSIRILEKAGFEHCGVSAESENSANSLLEMRLS
ncbi:GNAT family N-acetyltransferase [Shewanella olleyana]|uniref:GNAT family N-acetyltransferase n=1 Tax=Shewanella olleyana TaxID=135626 RepID=UPI00200C1B37|nr:GNAT family N-acetyltransferase [Shewanella olleyana]MCL1066055.1 GNAT family N-acetyltransferase [Shewanella olleyana]